MLGDFVFHYGYMLEAHGKNCGSKTHQPCSTVHVDMALCNSLGDKIFNPQDLKRINLYYKSMKKDRCWRRYNCLFIIPPQDLLTQNVMLMQLLITCVKYVFSLLWSQHGQFTDLTYCFDMIVRF